MNRKTVLVVDDSEDDREIYGRMLYYNGFDVLYAANGNEGLDVLREHAVDLIVLDMIMPELSGLGFCTTVRRKLELDIPIVALTAVPQNELEEEAIEAGCSSYMEKPVRPYAVVREVVRLIGRPARAGA